MKRNVAIATAAAALATGLGATAACSKPQTDESVATAATSGPSPTVTSTRNVLDEMRRWAQCMRQQGIDVPDPTEVKGGLVLPDPPGKDTPEDQRIAAAVEACRQYDTFSEYAEPFSTAQLQAWLTWAQCMRGHGVEVSDPDPAGWPPLVDLKKHRNQPDLLAAAEKDCLDELEAARDAGK